MTSRAEQRGFVIQNHVDGNKLEYISQTSIADKRIHEFSILKFRRDFRRDAATQINSTDSEKFERQVCGFHSIIIHEQVERLNAQIAFAFKRRMSNDSGRIALGNFRREPRRFFAAPGVPQKFVKVEQSRPGKNLFPTDLAGLRAQIFQKFDVQIRSRRKVRVAAFGSDRTPANSVPDQTCLTQTRAFNAGTGRTFGKKSLT